MSYDRSRAVREITADSQARGRWPVDNDPSSRYPVFTRANIGEVFPDVVMPFSWTLWGIPHSEPGWREALARLGAFDPGEFTADRMEMLSVFGGYGYLNVSASRIFGRRAPGLSPEAIDASFFGEQPDVPAYREEPWHRSAEHEARLGETIAWVFSNPALPELLDTRRSLLHLRDQRPLLGALEDGALLARTRQVCEQDWEALWVRHIMATYHAMIPSGAIAQLCAAVELPHCAADIYAVAGNVDSALPAKQLWELSRRAAGSAVLSAHFEGGIEGLEARIAEDPEPDAQGFRHAFDAFLREFGFRGPNEWEMASRCWEIARETPLAAIDVMRRSGAEASPAARMSERLRGREAAIAAVEERLAGDADALGQFRAAVAAGATFFAARERTKTNCAMLTHEMRMPMWELGRRFVERGVFERPEDFALLTDEEWSAAVADPPAVRELVRERRAGADHLAALQPPFIIDGAVPPLERWPRRSAAPLVGDGGPLRGQPGCAGVARGRARIVHDPSEPGDIAPADILVARYTDPSWTPLFSAVSGVVVEVGATVSHAVIVARELGVPCVTSVTDATRRLVDGALIEVDGGAGIVTVVEGGP